MKRIHPIFPVIPALVAATTHAGELTLEMKPFFVTHTLTATVLPAESVPLRLDPEEWTSFEIASIVGHGSAVKKGEPLLTFEPLEIDRAIADTRQAVATGKLELESARTVLAELERTVPETLARLKREAEVAAEELAYFTETDRKSSEERAGLALKQREQILASYKEELKQLLQMYEADDLTEDTEEIILQKQRDAVESAEFSLRMEVLDHKRTLAVLIPRKEISLTERRDDTALKLETETKELPRSLEAKKLEVATLQTALKRDEKALANLEADRKLFEIKAPADGIFYHGAIEQGKWTTGELVKNLIPGGSAPTTKAFATFIPATAPLVAQAFPDQSDALALTPGMNGVANPAGRTEGGIPVKLDSISATPATDQSYPATFSAQWPEGTKPVTGEELEIRLISYAVEKAISVPVKALEYGPQGWTIEVKLADGTTEHRLVTPGKSSEDTTEITAGLEEGQVVIVP